MKQSIGSKIDEQHANDQTKAGKLKCRVKELQDRPGRLYISVVWTGYYAPSDSDVISPPGWYMYQWIREDEDGLTVWENAICRD